MHRIFLLSSPSSSSQKQKEELFRTNYHLSFGNIKKAVVVEWNDDTRRLAEKQNSYYILVYTYVYVTTSLAQQLILSHEW